MNSLTRVFAALSVGLAAVGLGGCSSASKQAEVTQLTFASPEEAAQALHHAAATLDRDYLRQIFGPEIEELSSGDKEEDKREFEQFALALDTRREVRRDSDDSATLISGERGREFPVRLERVNNRWMFDTVDGVERIRDVRVGTNELRVIRFMRELPELQKEYASIDRDGDGIREYARKFRSSPGKRDGLYWKAGPGEEQSPLGPIAASAEANVSESYGYNGYWFKLLTKQGPGAPGGAKLYEVNGRLTEGFAVLAWPLYYGDSGVMSFMVGPDGVVYQKDLGEIRGEPKLNAYDPSGWERAVPEQ